MFLGNQTADSETGQVAPHLAEELGLPAAMNIESLRLDGPKLTVGAADGTAAWKPWRWRFRPWSACPPGVSPPGTCPWTGWSARSAGADWWCSPPAICGPNARWWGLAGARGRIRKVYFPGAKGAGRAYHRRAQGGGGKTPDAPRRKAERPGGPGHGRQGAQKWLIPKKPSGWLETIGIISRTGSRSSSWPRPGRWPRP